MRRQSEILSGRQTAGAVSRASSPPAAVETFARGAGNWREVASLQGALGQGQLIAPEVSTASPNQQAALM
jgi:hypothetical protein